MTDPFTDVRKNDLKPASTAGERQRRRRHTARGADFSSSERHLAAPSRRSGLSRPLGLIPIAIQDHSKDARQHADKTPVRRRQELAVRRAGTSRGNAVGPPGPEWVSVTWCDPGAVVVVWGGYGDRIRWKEDGRNSLW